MNKIVKILPLLIILLLGCKKEPEIAERTIAISSFETITLDSRFNVILTQGINESLKVSGNPALIDKVEAKIEGSELHISSTFKSAWLRPKNNKVTLYITVNNLKRINVNETCSINCSNQLTGPEIGMVVTGKYSEANLNLNCGTFYFWNNFPCSGKITLSGIVQELKIWNYALMQIDAQLLSCDNAHLENDSKGDIKAFTTNSLVYKIDGEGNIRVKGSPINIQSLGNEGEGQLYLE